jgi:hypothetical protein
MPRVKTPFGAVNFPDGTPEPEMQAVLDDMAVQQQQQPQPLSEPQQQGGGFARALQSAFAGVADQPVTSSVPYAVKVPGLSPEMGAQLRGSLTQMRQDDAASQLRQRAQRERELEKEKDRAKDLSLEQQRYKNRQTEMQMKLDQDIALIEREEENGTIQIGSRMVLLAVSTRRRTQRRAKASTPLRRMATRSRPRSAPPLCRRAQPCSLPARQTTASRRSQTRELRPR